MASIKEIAAACGVSVATVSKAMNDHSDISAETKEKVRRAAREMGYLPNSAAKALKTNRTNNIGVLFVDGDRSGLTHDYFSHVLDSFKREAESQGYDITFINCNKNRANSMSYLEHTRYRNFDGVVIACINFDSPEVLELVQSGIPVVTIDYVFNSCTAVISDNIRGMRDLMNYICGMGHRKIAFIHGESASVTQNRVSSFCRTAEEQGILIPDEYLRESSYRNGKKAYNITKELMTLPDPPTCIIYPDDVAALGGINAINELGLRVPEDISIAGYDGTSLAQYLRPRLTTLWQDTETMGRRAAEKLIDSIEHPRTALIEQIVVEGQVWTGETVADLRG